MVKFLNDVAFGVFILFAVLGILTSSVFLHELYHYYDLRDVTIPGDICFMNLPSENLTIIKALHSWTGRYNYYLDEDKLEEFKEARKYAEFKAYGVQIIFVLISTIFLMIVLSERTNYVLDNYFLEKEYL
jgi:Zn-dependent protease